MKPSPDLECCANPASINKVVITRTESKEKALRTVSLGTCEPSILSAASRKTIHQSGCEQRVDLLPVSASDI